MPDTITPTTTTIPANPSTPENHTPIIDPADLQTYRQGVEGLYEIRSGKIIPNGTADHAAVLYETFFKKAKERVRIFCRNLSADVFGRSAVVEELKKAVDRGVKVDICYQEDADPSVFLSFAESAPGQVTLRRANHGAEQFNTNFATKDEESIRVEPNRDECRAKAMMYAPDLVRDWNILFEKLTAV